MRRLTLRSPEKCGTCTYLCKFLIKGVCDRWISPCEISKRSFIPVKYETNKLARINGGRVRALARIVCEDRWHCQVCWYRFVLEESYTLKFRNVQVTTKIIFDEYLRPLRAAANFKVSLWFQSESLISKRAAPVCFESRAWRECCELICLLDTYTKTTNHVDCFLSLI